MAIKNTDGTPYQLQGSFSQFDPNNPEFDLFNSWDQEIIQIGGTPILYYECFIQMNTVDKLYLEDRGKLWSPVGVQLYGWYDPIPSQQSLTMFGFDSPDDEIMMQFNHEDVKAKIGHLPKIGSRLYTPHKKEHWVITRRNVEEFKLWGQLRLQILVKRFQEDLISGTGRVTQQEPDYKIDAI